MVAPDEVRIERGFAPDVLEALRARGHTVIEPVGQTFANSIAVTADGFAGAPERSAHARRYGGGEIARAQNKNSAKRYYLVAASA